MKLSKEQIQFNYDLSKLVQYATSLGIYMTLGEANRTKSQQLLYYYGKDVVETDNGLKLIDSHKRSWTKNSKHLERLAQDYNYFIADANGNMKLTYDYEILKPLGEYWESLSDQNEWGGFWKDKNGNPGKDTPHWQRNR